MMPLSPELRQRIISGVLLGGAVLLITWFSSIGFAALCVAGMIILMDEWWKLTKHRSRWFMPLGVIYILSATLALIYLRFTNVNILFAVLIIVWAGDIAAYVFGKLHGKRKIAPSISPGKTWEGLGGSVVVSAGVAAIMGYMAPVPHALLGGVFAVLGLGGDLFESSLKRKAGVKDSGKLIPGHGGLFDRVDALLPCAIFAAIALYIRSSMQ